MYTMLKFIGQVNGSAMMILAWLFWLIAFMVICLDLRSRRNWPNWIAIAVNVLIAEVICDLVWLRYFFPGGSYMNHGLGASFMLLLWPALLFVILIAIVMLKDKILTLFIKKNK